MKKHLIFDLDGTLIDSGTKISQEIFKYFQQHEPEYYDNARMVLKYSHGMSLQEIMFRIFECKKKGNIHSTQVFKILENLRKEVDFYPGVPKKIKELSKIYSLYISTGNSDEFAKTIMEVAGIKQCFEIIMGSSSIRKSSRHLEIFAGESNDPNFYRNSIFIGDGDRDREIAQSKGIDFIRIGQNHQDPYCINSVIEISPIIDQINLRTKRIIP